MQDSSLQILLGGLRRGYQRGAEKLPEHLVGKLFDVWDALPVVFDKEFGFRSV